MVSDPLSKPICVNRSRSKVVFMFMSTPLSYICREYHFFCVDDRPQISDRNHDRKQPPARLENRGRVVELANRVFLRKVISDCLLDQREKVELVPKQMRNEVVDLARNFKYALHEFEKRAQKLPYGILY